MKLNPLNLKKQCVMWGGYASAAGVSIAMPFVWPGFSVYLIYCLLPATFVGSAVGWLVGAFMQRRESSRAKVFENQQKELEEQYLLNESLKKEVRALHERQQTLLSMMEDAKSYNKNLQYEVFERETAEAAIAKTQENIELILHGGNLGYWDLDLPKQTYNYNERYASILGQEPQEIDRSIEWHNRQIHPEDFSSVEKSLKRHFRQETLTYTSEHRMLHKKNGWIWVLEHGKVIECNDAKQPTRMVGTLLDITTRKEHELHLQEVNKKLDQRSRALEENQHIIMGMMEDANDARSGLEKANKELLIARQKAEHATRAKSDFLASMSHEIRTPMNGIIGTASLISDTHLTSEQLEYIRIIQTSSDTLLTLLNDILDFSKIEAGKLDLEPVAFSLRESCENIIELLAPTAEEKGIDLILRYAPSTPSSIIGDAGRIRQILTNLISNALKFTHKGYVFVDVEVAGEANDRFATIQFKVEDTGIGVSEEELPKLFKKFSQADSSTTRAYGGTGLGLAICKQLVSLMGGEIEMQSEVGKGSLVLFSLPLAVAKNRHSPNIDSVRFQGESVLIIDEKRLNGAVLCEWMTRWGLTVDTAGSVNEAATKLDLQGHQVVLIEKRLLLAEKESIANSALFDACTLFVIGSMGSHNFSMLDRKGLTTNLLKPIRLKTLFNKLERALNYIPKNPLCRVEEKRLPGRIQISTTEKRRILLAEDNAVNQTVASRMLIKAGLEVDVAENGEQAIQKIKAGQQYDMVFMDCQMPKMDGYEAAKHIRKYEDLQTLGQQRIPIVALTANAMQGDRERCMKAGMDDYVSKPVKKEAILDMVRRHLKL